MMDRRGGGIENLVNYQMCFESFIDRKPGDISDDEVKNAILKAEDDVTKRFISERNGMISSYFECLERLKIKCKNNNTLDEYESFVATIMGADELVLTVHPKMLEDKIFIRDLGTSGKYRLVTIDPNENMDNRDNEGVPVHCETLLELSECIDEPKTTEKLFVRSFDVSIKIDLTIDTLRTRINETMENNTFDIPDPLKQSIKNIKSL